MNIQVIEEKNRTGASLKKEEKGRFRNKILVQIYEIQTPGEAEKMIEAGVDRMGSVVPILENWKHPEIREAIRLKAGTSIESSLIPLYSDPDMIYRTADYYEPDIMHFCESLSDHRGISKHVEALIELHRGFKTRFPEITIMRSIPIATGGNSRQVPTLELVKMFEPVSDIFLTDTLLIGEGENQTDEQPEAGFIGITGKTCDWHMAKELVDNTDMPVILAGGISPDNVYQGILKVNPAGVDSCTQTNLLDGNGNPVRFKKDVGKVKRLIEAVLQAENEITSYREEDK